ncbi:hypothetical protein DL96DRAFT_1729030 [Flagelloscypha sp. PMI_526]|nr:hypothetical protein DL96DRAFT_1729030 [Flagelloscypha sp. PMI_526]
MHDEAGSLICYAHTSDPSAPSSGVTSIEADTASVRSSKSTGRSSILASGAKGPSTAGTTHQDGPIDIAANMSNLSLGSGTPAGDECIRVVYVTEQVSHHPLISFFYASAPSQHVEISGGDQISAKVSGTTLRVSSGTFHKGLFVNITGGFGEGESYHITHPVASVNGILCGNFYVTIATLASSRKRATNTDRTTVLSSNTRKDGYPKLGISLKVSFTRTTKAKQHMRNGSR